MDIVEHNRAAWDKLVEEQDRWTRPVAPEAIERARCGEFDIYLTPSKPVPKSWFPELKGMPTLCLASGGGQQGPLLAAAGADVTVFDNSPKQLDQDRLVAKRDGLQIRTRQGDMADLSAIPDGEFKLIVHPCSNCFVPDVRPVWRECFRVLRRDGILLAGFDNAARWLFDDKDALCGTLIVRHAVPYSDLDHHPDRATNKDRCPLEFGHTLTDQIGGQIDAGFLITGFMEDRFDPSTDPISRFIDTFIATRGVKP
jgi:SAM-dependent methyltransferase